MPNIKPTATPTLPPVKRLDGKKAIAQPAPKPAPKPPASNAGEIDTQDKVDTQHTPAPGSQSPQLTGEKLKESLKKQIDAIQNNPKLKEQAVNTSKALAPSANKIITSQQIAAAKEPQGKYLSDQKFTLYGSRYSTGLQELSAKAPKGSKIHKYFTALRLLNQLKQAQAGKGPLVGDQKAIDILKMRESQLLSELKTLANDPEVKMAFDKVKREAMKSAFGANRRQAAQDFSDFLKSDKFVNDLKKLPLAKQQAKIKAEITKLASLDPKLAQQTLAAIAKKMVGNKLLDVIAQGGEKGKKAEEQLQKSIENHLKGDDALKSSKNLKTVAKAITKAIKAWKIDSVRDGGTQKISVLEALTKHLGDIPENIRKEAQQAIKGMSGGNVFNSLLATAGLLSGGIGLLTSGNAQEKFAAGSALADGLANAHHLANLMRVGNETKLMKILNQAQILGPLGDTLGAVSDAIGSITDFSKNKDYVGGTLKALSAAAGGVSAVVSVAMMAGASGPGAPLVLVGATAVGVGTWVADNYLGESQKAGDIRQDLEYLGLQGKEDRTAQQLKDLQGTFWNGQGNLDEMRAKAKTLNPDQKVQVLNYLMDKTLVTSGNETLIKNIIMDTPDKDFPTLISKLDTSKLADQLENKADALAVVKRMLEFDKKAGHIPSQKTKDFLMRLGKENRKAVIDHIFKDAALQPGKGLLDQKQFDQLKALAQPLQAQISQDEDLLYTYDYQFDRMLKKIQSAPPEKKAQILTDQMNRTAVTSERETFIYKALKETTPKDLPAVLAKLDVAKLAKTLENDKQAGDLAVQIAKAYKAQGKPVGPELKTFLRTLATGGRKNALKAFFDNVSKDSFVGGDKTLKSLKSLTTLGSDKVEKNEGWIDTNQADFNKMRIKIKNMATLDQKAEAIRNIMNRWVMNSERETAVFQILNDVPLNQLPELLPKLDVAKIAHELENDDQVVALAQRFAKGYKQADLTSIAPLETFLKKLATNKRTKALNKFFSSPETAKYLSAKQIDHLKGVTGLTQKKVADILGYVTEDADLKKVRALAKTLNPTQKAEVIKKLLSESHVEAAKETLIKDIILDTPAKELPALLKNLDTSLLISHLETDKEAAAVLKKAIQGYQVAGKKPDSALTNIMSKLAKDGRNAVLNTVLSDDSIKPQAFIRSLPQDSFNNLMQSVSGSGKGKDVLYTLMHHADWDKFNQFIKSTPDYDLNKLAGKLKTDDLAKVLSWSTYGSASADTKAKLVTIMENRLKTLSAANAAKLAQTVLDKIAASDIKKLPTGMAKALHQAFNNYLGSTWYVYSKPEDMMKQWQALKNHHAAV